MNKLLLGALAAIALAGLIGAPLAAASPADAATHHYSKLLHKDAEKLLKADRAKKSKLPTYESALSKMQTHCADGQGIWFLVDTVPGHGQRLKAMRAVNKKIGSAKHVDCTTAVIDYQSGTPIAISTPTPQPVDYALGTQGTTHTGFPCAVTVANWTAANGPVWVTVTADGTDTISVDVTTTQGPQVTKSFTIPGGEDTHIFVFSTVAPSNVSKVLVTAKGNDLEHAGSCYATGSPTA